MKILIIGGGGREHALAWKIRQSKHVTWLGMAPGNGGTSGLAEAVELDVNDPAAVARYATENEIALTVVGPEAPLAAGIGDAFDGETHFIFGPSAAAAKVESSKTFAKELMAAAKVPTAAYHSFRNAEDARTHIQSQSFPLVIKASGLAAGKGVIIASSLSEAMDAIDRIMVDREFGEAGDELIVEEYLEGPEASILAITDGDDYLLLPPAQDHKRIGEGDSGPNTGGMGAVSPTPFIDRAMTERIASEIIEPTLATLRDAGTPYRGVLYAGLMLTEQGPKVLEFNCRFGDPETQAVLPLLQVDLVDLMLVSVTGKLGAMLDQIGLGSTEWERISGGRHAANVVLASGGYPGSYAKGKEITGLPDDSEEAIIFHAGTKREGDKLLSDGGRVLGVTGLGASLTEALDNAYAAADQIQFEGKTLRRDIGWRALKA